MNFLKQMQLIAVAFILVMYFVNAANYPKMYKTKLQNGGGARSTTLAIEIQKILDQVKESKVLKKKENYKSLLDEMKKIFHTTVQARGGCPKSKVSKCSRG